MTLHVYYNDCKFIKVCLRCPIYIDTESCPPCGPYEHCESYTGYECVCDDGFTGNAGNCNGTCNCYTTVMMTAPLGMLNKFVILILIVSGQLWWHCMYRVRSCFLVSPHLLFIYIYSVAPSNSIVDIDECELYTLCQSPTGSICYNTIGSYECICPPDYTLSDDSNECISSKITIFRTHSIMIEH